jgi:hypothetical protein
MKCSRVAFSLLLAVFGTAAIAFGPAGGQAGLAADLGLEQSPHNDTLQGACHSQDVADWRKADSTDGQQPWTTACYPSDSVSDNSPPVGDAEESQSESGCDDDAAKEGCPAETGENGGNASTASDGSNWKYSCPEGDYAENKAAEEKANPDGNDTCDYDSESHWGTDHEHDYVSQDGEYGEHADTEHSDASETDRWSGAAGYDSESDVADGSHNSYEADGYDSQSEKTDETDESYESDSYNSEYGEAGEPSSSYEADAYDSQNQKTDETDDSYNSDSYNSEYGEAGEPSSSYEADASDSQNEKTDETDDSYKSDSYNSEYGEAGEPSSSYEADAYDSQSEKTDETDDSYKSDSYNSEYGEAGEPNYSYDAGAYDSESAKTDEADAGSQRYSEASPEEQNTYGEDAEEYRYEYEYSHPEQKYGHGEDASAEADHEMGAADEDQSDVEHGYGESQESRLGEVGETHRDASTDGEYVDPCQSDEHKGYDGYDTSEETSGEQSDWSKGGVAEGAVWEVIVSWASRSLEELGDACHSLSRQISGLSGRSLTAGTRQDRTVN